MNKKLLYFIFFTVCHLFLMSCGDSNEDYAQCPYSQWTKQEIARAATANGISYMTEQEKRVLFLCNLARIDGYKFSQTFGASYLQDNTNSYVVSLLQDIKTVKNRTMLVPNEKLCQTAKNHTVDMGETGNVGHISSDGTSFADRVRKKYGDGGIGECCSYGYSDPLDIVMQLLIDDGVSNLGHRHLVLNMGADYNEAGVSIKPHKGYEHNCVIDFGQKKMK